MVIDILAGTVVHFLDLKKSSHVLATGLPEYFLRLCTRQHQDATSSDSGVLCLVLVYVLLSDLGSAQKRVELQKRIELQKYLNEAEQRRLVDLFDISMAAMCLHPTDDIRHQS